MGFVLASEPHSTAESTSDFAVLTVVNSSTKMNSAAYGLWPAFAALLLLVLEFN